MTTTFFVSSKLPVKKTHIPLVENIVSAISFNLFPLVYFSISSDNRSRSSLSIKRKVSDLVRAKCDNSVMFPLMACHFSSSNFESLDFHEWNLDEMEIMYHGRAYLRELTIRNFVLIEDQTAIFGPGLNIVTGESGSGKSVLLSGLNQVLGAPLPDDCVRSPALSAVLQGTMWADAEFMASLSERVAEFSTSAARALKASPPVFSADSQKQYYQIRLEREILKPSSDFENTREGPAKSKKSKSTCKLNGVVIPLRLLRFVGSLLVDVNGQNSQSSLKQESSQLSLLDHQAGAEAEKLRTQFSELSSEASAVWSQLAELGGPGEEDEESLQNLVDEVASLGLEVGEVEELKAEDRALELGATVVARCQQCVADVAGSGSRSAVGRLRAGRRELVQVAQEEIDQDTSQGEGVPETVIGARWQAVEEALGLMEQAEAMLTKAVSAVEEFASEVQYSDRRREEIALRLRQVDLVRKKYGIDTAEELLSLAEKAAEKLGSFGDLESVRADLAARFASLSLQLGGTAVELSKVRRVAAEGTRAAVEEVLSELGMEHSRFHVDVYWERGAPSGSDSTNNVPLSSLSSWQSDSDSDSEEDGSAAELQQDGCAADLSIDDRLLRVASANEVGESASCHYRYSPSGLDKVSFKLSSGTGNPLLPLVHVASGGESSRILLALKAVSGSGDADLPITVFDEVDSGVGGRIGSRVGSTLKKICSSGRQIICVTHLPQVAVHGDAHINVRKEEGSDGRLQTKIVHLESELERASEIAQMLGMAIPEAVDLFKGIIESGDGFLDPQPWMLDIEKDPRYASPEIISK